MARDQHQLQILSEQRSKESALFTAQRNYDQLFKDGQLINPEDAAYADSLRQSIAGLKGEISSLGKEYAGLNGDQGLWVEGIMQAGQAVSRLMG